MTDNLANMSSWRPEMRCTLDVRTAGTMLPSVSSYGSETFDNFYLRPDESVRWKQAVTTAEQKPAVGQLLDYLYDVRDLYTVEHSQRVGQLNAAIALRMGCADEVIQDAAISGFVHDIGKRFFQHIIHIDDLLGDEEYQAVKLHAPYGAQMVAASGLGRRITQAAGNHHGYQRDAYPVFPQALYVAGSIGPLSPNMLLVPALH